MNAELPPRLRDRIEVTADGCWEWRGWRTKPWGYGMARWAGRDQGVHRITYELLVGPIPDGLVIDHLCKNASCCNPAHLEAVTQRTNVMRGNSEVARNPSKTHCPRGHEYTATNTHVRPQGWRTCRACGREKANENQARQTIYMREYRRRKRESK